MLSKNDIRNDFRQFKNLDIMTAQWPSQESNLINEGPWQHISAVVAMSKTIQKPMHFPGNLPA